MLFPVVLSKEQSKFALRLWDELPASQDPPQTGSVGGWEDDGVFDSAERDYDDDDIDEDGSEAGGSRDVWEDEDLFDSYKRDFDEDEDDDEGGPIGREEEPPVLEWVLSGVAAATQGQHAGLNVAVQDLVASLFLGFSPEGEISHPIAVFMMLRAASTPSPRDVCSMLAAVQYCIRLTAFNEARIVSSGTCQPLDTAFGSLRRWVLEEEATIYSWVRYHISQTSKASSRHHEASNMEFLNAEKTIILYKNQSWDLEAYRKYCKSLPLSCRDQITKLLGDVEWADLWDKVTKREGNGYHEDISREDVGYSVFEDKQNQVDTLWITLMERMLAANYWQKGVVNLPGGGAEIGWVREAVEEWLGRADDLLYLLYVCCFEGFACPPRGSEFTSTLIRNIPGRIRNVYMLNFILTIILRYNKTSSVTGVDKLVPRALPWAVQELLCFYIAVIRPMVWFLCLKALHLPPAQISMLRTHLWVRHDGRFLDSHDLTRGMQRAIFKTVGEAVAPFYGLRTARQLRKAWGREALTQLPQIQDLNQASRAVEEKENRLSRAARDLFYAGSSSNPFKFFKPVISPFTLRKIQVLCQALHTYFGYDPPPRGKLTIHEPEVPAWLFTSVEKPFLPKGR